jgi:carbon storage regulator CsrA
MLVLSRRLKDQVTFPELGITVEVLNVNGSTVRLGFSAPESIRILRGELDAGSPASTTVDFAPTPK